MVYCVRTTERSVAERSIAMMTLASAAARGLPRRCCATPRSAPAPCRVEARHVRCVKPSHLAAQREDAMNPN